MGNPTDSIARFVGAEEKDAAALGASVAGQVAGGILGGLLFLIGKAFDDDAKIANFVDVKDVFMQGLLTYVLIAFVVVTFLLGTAGKDENFRALSFGPSLINTFHGDSDGQWEDHWLHWVAPIVGGILAALLAKFNNRGDAAGTPSAGESA